METKKKEEKKLRDPLERLHRAFRERINPVLTFQPDIARQQL
jgi:hypothetical protein